MNTVYDSCGWVLVFCCLFLEWNTSCISQASRYVHLVMCFVNKNYMQSAKLASNLLYAVIVKVAICQTDFHAVKNPGIFLKGK